MFAKTDNDTSIDHRRPRKRLLAIAVATALTASAALPLLYHATPANALANSEAAVTAPNFADLVERVKPSVVNISTSSTGGAMASMPDLPPGHPLHELFKRQFPQGGRNMPSPSGQGSGFIVSADGYIVTNYHVVNDANEITVTLNDGSQHPAKLEGGDEKTDLAVLKIEADESLPFVTFGDSDAVRAGHWVIAIGNPFGLGGTVTAGIVSARGRDIQAGPFDDFIQVDAPINRGNSGGPLFDVNGEVIGINTAIFSPNGGSVGIGFAIPSAMASDVVAELRADGVVERGWLGVHIQSLTSDIAASLGLGDDAGALVTEVVTGSPAQSAGLEPGDVILSANETDIESPKDLSRLVAGLEPESTLELEVWHKGEKDDRSVDISATPGAAIAAADREESTPPTGARIGVAVAALTPELKQRFNLDSELTGTVVVEVEPDSPAAAGNVRPGDVIKRIGHEPVSSPADVVEGVRRAASSDEKVVLLLLSRDGNSLFIALPLA